MLPTSTPAWLGVILVSLAVLTESRLHASLTIVANGSTSYNDSDFFSVTYDSSHGSGSPSLTNLTLDLRAGSDGNAYWDASDTFIIDEGSTSFSSSVVSMGWVDGTSGSMDIGFDAGHFLAGDVFTFGYDTDWLTGNNGSIANDSGGAFGYRDVGVTATWSDGSTSYGVFDRDHSTRSTAVLNVPLGIFHTEFSAEDIVSNRGEEIPLNLDLSQNQNTSDFYISGLPDGAHLSHGEDVGNGAWIVSSTDMANLRLIPSLTYTGQFMLTINQDIYNALTAGSSGTFGGGTSDRESLSSGNTHFTYDSSGTVADNHFIVTDDGDEGNSSWAPLQDRQEPGFGYFLVGNANGYANTLFKQTITGLEINTVYHLSAFVANLSPNEMAEVSFRVDGQEIYSTSLIDSWDGSGTGVWQEFGGSYMTATNTSVNFEIVSTSNGVIALDDVLFAESYEDDLLITIHDIGRTDSPMYYTFTLTNNHNVGMTVNFLDTLPAGLVWDEEYEPLVDGNAAVPLPLYSDYSQTVAITGMTLPPGTTYMSLRTLPPSAGGDYTNQAQVVVADEDFHPETFIAEAVFSVIGN